MHALTYSDMARTDPIVKQALTELASYEQSQSVPPSQSSQLYPTSTTYSTPASSSASVYPHPQPYSTPPINPSGLASSSTSPVYPHSNSSQPFSSFPTNSTPLSNPDYPPPAPHSLPSEVPVSHSTIDSSSHHPQAGIESTSSIQDPSCDIPSKE